MSKNKDLPTVRKNLHSLLSNVRIVGFVVLLAITTLLVGPIVEGKMFPVLAEAHGEYLYAQDKKMFFRFTSNQQRSCKLVDVRVLVDKDIWDNEEPVKGAIWSSEYRFGPPVLGKQDLGVWIVVPEGDQVIVDASWQCHQFWQTRQVVGIWERPSKGK